MKKLIITFLIAVVFALITPAQGGGPQIFDIDSPAKLIDNLLAGDSTVTGLWNYQSGLLSRGVAGAPLVVKEAGDSTAGLFNWQHNGDYGYLIHLTGGDDFSGSGLLGVGVDSGGLGIVVANYKTGTGLYISQKPTISSASAYGIYGVQNSSLAPLMFADQNATDSAPLIKLQGNGNSNNNVIIITDSSGAITFSAKDNGSVSLATLTATSSVTTDDITYRTIQDMDINYPSGQTLYFKKGGTAVGRWDSGGNFIGGAAALFTSYIKASDFRLNALNTAPSSATATGTLGEIRITSDYIYICVATNTWKRVLIETW